MKRRLAALALCMCAWVPVACVMEGGSDQPNRIEETFSGVVTGKEGRPAAGARVKLFAGAYAPGYENGLLASGAKLDTEVVANAAGRFAVRAFTGRHFLEFRSIDSTRIGIKDSFPAATPGSLGETGLAEAASLRGVVTSSIRPAFLHLAGTHFRAVTDSGGNFYFPLLPPGAFRLVADFGGENSGSRVSIATIDLESGQALDLDTVRSGPGQINLYDFDSDTPFNGLRGLAYPFAQPDTSRIGKWAPLPMALVTSGALHKRSFTSNLDKGQSVGFALGNGYYDLSRMTAFSFSGKGYGRVEVHLHSEIIPNGKAGFRATITLDSIWTEYSLRPGDFGVPAGSSSDSAGATWDKGKAGISKITFEAAENGTVLFLDDIRMEGMDYTDLGASRPAGQDAFP